jgi:uncharacterized membrane protein
MNRKIVLVDYLRVRWNLRTEISKLLTISVSFSMLLIAARIAYTGRLTFASLVWNLFLAVIPFLISDTLTRKVDRQKQKLLFAMLCFVWLLFIPNTFYILTDLYHLGDDHNDYRMPDWFDLTLIFSFAWNGLLLGLISVRQMEKLCALTVIKKYPIRFIYPVMLFNALGVYIGRYLRYNSWDLVADPFHLIRDICTICIHPMADRYAWGMIICYSLLMTIIYSTVKQMSSSASRIFT